jgi:isopentenyl-diphosphate delta-isomerase type 1
MTDKTNTPDEIVDVVNEDDEIIGQSTKGEVNSNPTLIHREIGVLIYDDQGRLLIQQRSRKKKLMPYYWIISVAGHVPSGMEPEDAAHMELREELGFDTKLVFYEKTLLKYPNETHFAYGYLGKIPKGTKVVVDPHETERCKFVTAQDLEAMIKSGEKVEEYSLADFRKFFSGKLDQYLKHL